MLTGLNSTSSEKKSSYCFNTMSRIQTMKKAIIQTEKLVKKTKESVEFELNKMLKNGNIAVDLQKLTIKIKMLREQLCKEQIELELLKNQSLSFKQPTLNKLTNLSSSLNNHHLSNHQSNNLFNNSNNLSFNLPNSLPASLSNNLNNSLSINSSNLPNSFLNHSSNSTYYSINNSIPNSICNSINNNSTINCSSKDEIKLVQFDRDCLERDKKLIAKLENEIVIKNNLLRQINESLLFTQRKLITELYQIFLIKESQDGKYTILGLQLPDLNDPLDENDAQIRISLGYCAQLLITISKLFDLPLKHQILFSGSQSWITNESENSKLKDKKYPLFLNRDKSKFNIAIYLLNENIAQLRHHFNLHTNDHKKLSSNLFNLFNDKLLLKSDED